jgi:hypothetical protein
MLFIAISAFYTFPYRLFLTILFFNRTLLIATILPLDNKLFML